MTSANENEPGFGIGAVSRLTGIPLDTLRVWERRYKLVEPQRSADNRRRYSREDVARLKLIKQLVEEGHAVSSVAHLPEDALRERLQAHLEAPAQPAAGGRPRRVLVCGDALPFLVEHWREELAGVEIVGGHTAYADFERDALALRPDALVVEMPSVQPEQAGLLRQLAARSGADRTVLVYGFAARELLGRLQKDGVIALKAPVTPAVLARACAGVQGFAVEAPADGAIPPRRFDGETLAAVANISTAIRCECPRHLADLLFRLTAFEDYSADCENRNAQDAEVHARLHRAAANARALLEEALGYLIEAEEIDLAGV